MPDFHITSVRYTDSQAVRVLQSYVAGSRGRQRRVPRGLPRNAVAHFLKENITLDCSPSIVNRALDAMRFYEIPELAQHFRALLMGREQSYDELRRSCFLLQALGDFGSPDDTTWAGAYFDRILAQKPRSEYLVDLLLETLLALAPPAPLAVFAERIRSIDIGSADSRLSLELRDIVRNQLPATADHIAAKVRLLSTNADKRAEELISIYLDQSDLCEPYLVNWAARMLRRDAMDGNGPSICARLASAIERLAADQGPISETDLLMARAAQAIIYLGGDPDPAWRRAAANAHRDGFRSFLWDDLEP